MAGHRRIASDLFEKLRERAVPRNPIEAALELNLDDYRGERQSVRAYARLWGWSRERVERLIKLYTDSFGDLSLAARVESHPASDRPATDHATGRATGHIIPTTARTYEAAPAGGKSTDPATDRPETGHALRQEYEYEGREAPPNRPKAARVGREEEQINRARAAVNRALMRLGPMDQDAYDEADQRMWAIQRTFLTCGQVANEERLGGYYRGTSQIPTVFLATACERALAAEERGFPPSIKAIADAGPAVAMAWRKRQREAGQHAPN